MREFLKQTIAHRAPSLYVLLLRLRLLWRILFHLGLDVRALNLFWNVQPYTMVGHARLLSLYDMAQQVESLGMKGAFVECGVWKGGCSAIMAAVANQYGGQRNTWMFDSFEGLPQPTKKDGTKAASYAQQHTEGKLVTIGMNVGPLEDVERLLFSTLKLPREAVRIMRGWFQETLPQQRKEIGAIAILRLDGDWYESTKCILENLYDNVVFNGYIIVDDYGSWEGCKKAVDEFLEQRNIQPNLHMIDASGLYFQKP